MRRHYFQHCNHTFSYLDAEGDGPLLLALHGHWMEATTFIPLAAALLPDWRLIALDQRGHGYSDHTKSYKRSDYLHDILALLIHLQIRKPIILLGNTLGGINAYQFAARHPQYIRAMIIEDIGAELTGDIRFARDWVGTFDTYEALTERVDPRLLPYLKDSIRKTPAGWRFAFDPEQTIVSHSHVLGDHWSDWLSSTCPALLIRGQDSRVTTEAHCQAMVTRRPNTQLTILAGGHVVHADNLTLFAQSVRAFLETLPIQAAEFLL